MMAALCTKSERFNESMAKWFHDSGSSVYIFLDDLPSQTGVCLHNARQCKIAKKKLSLFVLQSKGISLPLNVSVTPFHLTIPCPSPRHLC